LGCAAELGHAAGVFGEGFGEDLDGDIAVQLGVRGAVHFAHAALA
jgi:hypothetical protein